MIVTVGRDNFAFEQLVAQRLANDCVNTGSGPSRRIALVLWDVLEGLARHVAGTKGLSTVDGETQLRPGLGFKRKTL